MYVQNFTNFTVLWRSAQYIRTSVLTCVLAMFFCFHQRRQYLSTEEAIPSPQGGVFRNIGFVSCKTHPASYDELAKTYPVEVVLENVNTHQQFTVRTKYLFGCDGARSKVRKCIAGGGDGDGEWKGKITMQGEATDIIWVSGSSNQL